MTGGKSTGAYRWFMPLSGDVWQKIFTTWFSPSVTVNYQGDPAIEQRVVTEVASYGRQLGWLSEIVLALAKKEPLPQDTLNNLEAAIDQIEEIKSRSDLVNKAESALDRLSPKELDALIKRRAKQFQQAEP